MLERRVHLMMAEREHALLEEIAERRGVSIAALIREAVAQVYGVTSDQERRRVAWERLNSSTPIPVPADPADLDLEAATMWDAS
jgi:hypothetical protein